MSFEALKTRTWNLGYILNNAPCCVFKDLVRDKIEALYKIKKKIYFIWIRKSN